MAITQQQIANGVQQLRDRGEPDEVIQEFIARATAIQRSAKAQQTQQQQPQEGQMQLQTPQEQQQMQGVQMGQGQGMPASNRFIPEIVAGTDEQRSAAMARNFQKQMGFTDRVDPTAGLDMAGRMMLRAAPTQEEKAMYLDTEYGAGNWSHLPNGKFLVKIDDGDTGKKKWVVNDPQGLDMGDVAEFIPKVPEYIASFVAQASKIPAVGASNPEFLMAAAVPVVAGEIIGALTDAAFRGTLGKPINATEIVKRRAVNLAVGTGLNSAFMKGVQKIGGLNEANALLKKTWRAFREEGQEAKQMLKGRGYYVTSEAELAPAILEKNASSLTAAEAGETVARVLTEFDQRANNAASRELGAAAKSVEQRSAALLDSAAPAIAENQTQAGLAITGGVKSHFVTQSATSNALYKQAFDEINAASGGKTTGVIKLTETKKIIDDMLANRMVDAKGKPINIGPEMIKTLTETLRAVGTGQTVQAVRTLRTKMGAAMNGEATLFPGLPAAAAARMWGGLSDDLTAGIATVGGQGGKTLRMADAHYKATIMAVEANPLLNKIANGKVVDTADVIGALGKGGLNDWAALKSVLPPNTYALAKRAVVNTLLTGEDVMINGAPYKDVIGIGKLLSNKNFLPEVKDEIFGSSAVWKGIQQIGKEQEYIAAKQGVFSNAGAVDADAIRQVAYDIKTQGFAAANKALGRAIAIQTKRIDSVQNSLVSQVASGSTVAAAKDPVALMDGLMSGRFSPALVSSALNKLPPQTRDQVSRAAFQRVFEKASDTALSLVNSSRGRVYDPSQVANVILGSPQQRLALQNMIGKERYDTAKEWVTFTLQRERERARSAAYATTVGRIASVLPYTKLLMARFGSEVIQTAAGKRVLTGLSPQSAALFAESRILQRNPIKTAAATTIINRAYSNAKFEDYLGLMSNYTDDQRDAIDSFILGPK
jgi:hypothetical protein